MDAGACAPVDDALVVWPFDDGKGLIARDCTGNYPGTISDSGTTWSPGRHGGIALTFDTADAMGDGAHVSPPAGSKVDEVGGVGGRKPFTAATWYKSTAVNNYDFERYLVTRLGDGFSDAWGLGISGVTGTEAHPAHITLFYANIDASRGGQVSSDSFDNEGWTHVAVTYDGDTRVAFYVNGSPMGKDDIAVADYVPLNGGLFAGSAGNTTKAFEGAVSGMRIYTRALSATEIAMLAKY